MLAGVAPRDERGDWCAALSSLASLFYLALFRCTRTAFRPFFGTNPTWIKQRVSPEDRANFDLRTLGRRFLRAVEDLSSIVSRVGVDERPQSCVQVAVGESSQLEVATGSIGTVITSPPYCTRIDYAIATLPELAALGLSQKSFRDLRDKMIGTPTITHGAGTDDSWGATAASLLGSVARHPSRASSSYYKTFFHQYLSGMRDSIAELHRAVRPAGAIVMVVQDSYYKELHADLPRIVEEMGAGCGWELLIRHDYEVVTKASINTRARLYRDRRSATEAVLVFKR